MPSDMIWWLHFCHQLVWYMVTAFLSHSIVSWLETVYGSIFEFHGRGLCEAFSRYYYAHVCYRAWLEYKLREWSVLMSELKMHFLDRVFTRYSAECIQCYIVYILCRLVYYSHTFFENQEPQLLCATVRGRTEPPWRSRSVARFLNTIFHL